MWHRGLRFVAVLLTIFLLPISVAAAAHLLTAEPRTEPKARLDCVPYQKPTSVEQVNAFVTRQRATPGFGGGDVGASTLLVDGRRFWVFGDTVRPGGSIVRNSVLLMGSGCASVYRPADNGAAIPDRSDGVGYWPASVVSVPDGVGGSRVAVGLMRVRPTGLGMWDYEIVGSSVARFLVPANAVPQFERVTDLDRDDPDPGRPMWGAASTVDSDGDTVYVYGTATTGEELVFGYSLHVARTTVAGYLSKKTWQYWDGSGWSPQESHAVALVPAENGVSRALSVFQQRGSWYAVSKRHDYLGSDLVVWKASEPTGPFVASEPVLKITTDDAWMTYMPLAHPELLPRDGTVVVSWSVNSLDPKVVQRDPTLYRPRFQRIRLP